MSDYLSVKLLRRVCVVCGHLLATSHRKTWHPWCPKPVRKGRRRPPGKENPP